MTYGIDVANGENASTAPIKDLLFTSQAISLKNVIYGSGSITPTIYTNPNNGDHYLQAAVTVPHNLGYEPIVLVYFRPGNTDAVSQGADTNDPAVYGLMDNFLCTTIVDDVNLYLQFRNCVAGFNVDYRYFIFVERAV